MNKRTVRTRRFDVPFDVISLAPPSGSVLWIGPETKLVGWHLERIDVGRGPGRFARASEALQTIFEGFEVDDEVCVSGTGPLAFASFTFDDASGDAVLTIPHVIVGTRRSTAWVTTIGDEEVPVPANASDLQVPKIRYAGPSVGEIEWLEAVEAAIDAIRSGPLQKVVLARDVQVWADESFDVCALAARLARRFPQCYTFVNDGLVGATPELLARRTGATIESLVLAGSARRSGDDAEDEAIGKELLESLKDTHEHRLALDSVVERLDAICSDLRVDAEPWLLKLANVQHLATSISGTLDDDRTILEIVGTLHPTASVCGTPAQAALEVIRTLEKVDRGRYAGPIGWTDGHGNGEFGLALRCADVHGTRARLWAGNGIVDASIPEAELEETRLKLRAMQSALEN
jgi:menaquinone-specific isochorismate synthase